MKRRQFLASSGVVLGLAAAGCTGDSDDSGGNGNGNDNGTGDTVQYEVFDLPARLSRPAWYLEEAIGHLAVIDSRPDEPWMLDDPDGIDGLDEWFGETDFADSIVLYVLTTGPSTCWDRVGVEGIELDAGTLTGTVTAVNNGNGGCGNAISHPAAFVRVTADDIPSDIAMEVTDGWGETATVEPSPAADGELDGGIRPPGEPERFPSETACDVAGFERHWSADGPIAWGDTTDEGGTPVFALRLHNPQADGSGLFEFARGDDFTVTLTNVTDEEQYTGNRYKYGLQVQLEDGTWQDVRGSDDGQLLGYTDEALAHGPGTGFEWSLTLTEDGLVDGHVHEDSLTVCPDLQPGRYRFVFFGTGANENVAVGFDLVE